MVWLKKPTPIIVKIKNIFLILQIVLIDSTIATISFVNQQN